MNYNDKYEPFDNIYGKNINIYPYIESINEVRRLEKLDQLETYDKYMSIPTHLLNLIYLLYLSRMNLTFLFQYSILLDNIRIYQILEL